MTKTCENCENKFQCDWKDDNIACDGWKRKEFQYEKVLRLLKERPQTTMGLTAKFIPAPQKSIEILRNKGHIILTEPVEGSTHKIYVLVQEDKSNVVQASFGDEYKKVSGER